MSDQHILGLFAQPAAAADALDRLRAVGFPDSRLELMTAAPYPDGAFGEPPVEHRLYMFPLAGAAIGFILSLFFTVGTQLAWPLPTGGKPIVAVPPTMIVMYEGTLLGAIVFTVIGILVESRLPALPLHLYDHRISEGYIGLLVTAQAADLDRAEAELRTSGADEIVQRHDPVRE
jgi:hypothetical protein